MNAIFRTWDEPTTDLLGINRFIKRHTGQEIQLRFGSSDRQAIRAEVLFPDVKNVISPMHVIEPSGGCLTYSVDIKDFNHWRFIATGAVLAFWHIVPTETLFREQAEKITFKEDGSHIYGYWRKTNRRHEDYLTIWTHRCWLPFASSQYNTLLDEHPESNWLTMTTEDGFTTSSFSPFDLTLKTE